MKVAILTYPIHSNFGFIMQAYALQEQLRRLGHTPYTLNVIAPRPRKINIIKQTIKDVFYTIKGVCGYRMFRYWPTEEQKMFLDRHTLDFVKENINLTSPIVVESDFLREDIQNFDYYIVGSDQVWRYSYINNIRNYFFDFLPDTKKRISYAASFGISYCDYDDSSRLDCSQLLKKFSLVTVREFDGVDICKQAFGVDAVKVLDPVFLLDKQDYINLSQKGKVKSLDKFLLAYILDPNEKKLDFIQKIAKKKGLKIVDILPQKFHLKGPKHIEECVFPSIYDILASFAQCDYVVTDSFHGTAFSVIFNKKFTIFSNDYRGNSRLKSILKTFNLEQRLYSEHHNVDRSVDYDNVNKIISEQRLMSAELLEKSLCL